MRVTVNVLPAEAVWAGEELRRSVVEALAAGPELQAAPDHRVRREHQGTVAWSEPVPVRGTAPGVTARELRVREETRITVAHLAN